MNAKHTQQAVAPDFELTDTQGRTIRLSDYRGKPVVLVLLRGFM
jgi:peroxiredoxin